jgi:hypothetical protein
VVPEALTTMADEIAIDEKSYHDWLTEALARDEATWAALEAKLKTLRVRRDPDADGSEVPRDC